MHAKKVFVVKNFKSPYVEQAIFFLREDAPPSAALSDAVSEAERIVTGYLEEIACPRPPKKKSGGKLLATLIGIFSFAALLFILL